MLSVIKFHNKQFMSFLLLISFRRLIKYHRIFCDDVTNMCSIRVNRALEISLFIVLFPVFLFLVSFNIHPLILDLIVYLPLTFYLTLNLLMFSTCHSNVLN